MKIISGVGVYLSVSWSKKMRKKPSSSKCDKRLKKKEVRKVKSCLAFRIWDRQERAFVEESESLHCFTDWMIESTSGEVLKLVGCPTSSGECFYTVESEGEDNNPISKRNASARYQVTQWTGLQDSQGNLVYEGDTIEFEYYVGDLAWQEMDMDEADAQKKMIGRTYRAVVEREASSTNMQLTVKFNKGEAYFPLAYAGGRTSKIVGNIFENTSKARKAKTR